MESYRHYEMMLTDDEARFLDKHLRATAGALRASSEGGRAALLERVVQRLSPKNTEDLNSERRRSAIIAQASVWRTHPDDLFLELHFTLAKDSQIPDWLLEALEGRRILEPAHPELSGVFVVDGYVPWLALTAHPSDSLFIRNMESPDRAALEIVHRLRSEGLDAHAVAEVLLEYVWPDGKPVLSVQVLELVASDHLSEDKRERIESYIRKEHGNLMGPFVCSIEHSVEHTGDHWIFAHTTPLASPSRRPR